MKIVIIGSGNVAEGIAVALSERNICPIEICSRNRANASALAEKVGCNYTDDFENITEADVYIISVSDDVIDIVSSKLNAGSAIVLHTAGSISQQCLSKHQNHGIIYPLQTFTKGRYVDFKEIPILIEANSQETLQVIKNLALQLSDNVIESDLNYRIKVHIAAVFACNFTNHMYVVAESILGENHISFDLLKPLIRETTNKVIDAKSPANVQTGPAVRNDFKTKSRHCDLLINRPILKSIYINLSQSIWEISKKILRK